MGGTSEERSVASSCDGVPANKIFDRTWVPDTWTDRTWSAGIWNDETWNGALGSAYAYGPKISDTGGTSMELRPLETSDLEKVIGLTASAAEMNLMDGVTASTADLNALDVAVKVDATSKVALQNVTLQKTLSLSTQYEAVASTVYGSNSCSNETDCRKTCTGDSTCGVHRI